MYGCGEMMGGLRIRIELAAHPDRPDPEHRRPDRIPPQLRLVADRRERSDGKNPDSKNSWDFLNCGARVRRSLPACDDDARADGPRAADLRAGDRASVRAMPCQPLWRQTANGLRPGVCGERTSSAERTSLWRSRRASACLPTRRLGLPRRHDGRLRPARRIRAWRDERIRSGAGNDGLVSSVLRPSSAAALGCARLSLAS